MVAASRAVSSLAREGFRVVSRKGCERRVTGGEREGMTEVIQGVDREAWIGGEGRGESEFEESGGRWMPRGRHDFKRFAGGVNINLGK